MNDSPFLSSAVIAAVLGWIFKLLADRNEQNKKRINAVEIILVNIDLAVNALEQFIPNFKEDAKKLIASNDAHFFTPSNDSLNNTISILEDHIVLLPPNLVSKIMIFNSYDVNLNELLQEMSRNDFAKFHKSRKEKIVNHTEGVAKTLIPIGKELITEINNYLKAEADTLCNRCYICCCNFIKDATKPQDK